MSKQLQIGNEIFDYPETGTNPEESWGEEATSWAEAVTNVISTIFGPNDIVLTTVALANNQVTPADIIGLKFSTAQVIYLKIEAIIERVVTVGLSDEVYTESLEILGNFNNGDFYISQESVGNAGITITVNSSGQFKYISTDMPGQLSCTIQFKASTISS